MTRQASTNRLFNYIWHPLYVVLQLTWGFFQTLAGFILFLYHFKSPHDLYHGSIRTKWSTFNGISLGLFIFTPMKAMSTCLNADSTSNRVLKNSATGYPCMNTAIRISL